MKGLFVRLGTTLALVVVGAALAQCPAVTAADSQGVAPGAFPYQYELAEFEGLAGCELSFSENPAIAEMNARIVGNPSTLPPVAERLPAEPLVVAPYEQIGTYGGTLAGLSRATEAGTSDLLSIRHVNLVRFSDDLQTLVPNVAKGWAWNDDFTELTFHLREGHKWSDGQPFTAEDVVFWYEDLILNQEIFPNTPARWLFAGNPMQVEAVDATTVKMTFPVPSPGIVSRFAVDFAQPFQPKHFFMDKHVRYNPDANAAAAEAGFESWADWVNNYYGASDWKDVPSPLLKGTDTQVLPTLESHILIEDTATGRHLVANPYFHMVDTAGNQLPYINEIDEVYVTDKEVQNLKITNGEVTYKQQAIFLEDFPLLKENESNGNYQVDLAPALGENVVYSFNRTHKDPVLREIFNDVRFNQAMSLAMNREEINEIVYLGQGTPLQGMPVEPATVGFVTDEHLNAFIEYDPDGANSLLDAMGLADSDGDGVRERPDGRPLIVRLVYASQGAPVQMQELVRDYWSAVGVRIDLKEVTSDEYRADANNNDLDITVWVNDGVSGPSISQDFTELIPPFGDFFNPGTGFEWAAWKQSDGAEGSEPPDYILELYELADQFLQVPLGSEESDRIGGEIVDIHVDNLLFIGTVGNIVNPIMHRADLGNYRAFTAKTYDYYWTYPYRPNQWFLSQ
ncbi:MAG: ABC transporter substrate-binding protein [Trueperaceae bacterium]|nr:MAG: ABC transporter substrate-binding protein [Trueperaceae bacterium]